MLTGCSSFRACIRSFIHVWTEHRHQLPIECRKELGLGASYANTQLATVCPELAVASSRSHLERYFFVASEADLRKTLGATLDKAWAGGSGANGSGAMDKGKARDFGCPINLPSCRSEHSKPHEQWTARESAAHVKNKHGTTRMCPFGVGAWCTQSPQKLNVDQLEQHILEHRNAVQRSDAKAQKELREHKANYDIAKKRKQFSAISSLSPPTLSKVLQAPIVGVGLTLLTTRLRSQCLKCMNAGLTTPIEEK